MKRTVGSSCALLALCLANTASADRADALERLRAIPPLAQLAATGASQFPTAPTLALHLGPSIDVRATDVVDVPRSTREGVAIFEDAALDTDLVWVPTAAGFEEWRVIRSPRAALSTHHRLTAAANIADVRVVGDRIEARDVDGALAVRTEPIVAFDARGASLPVTLRVTPAGTQAWELVVEIDPVAASRATYPLALDPAWNFGFGFSVGRAYPCVSVLSDGKVLVVGGDDGKGHPGNFSDLYDPATATVTNYTTGYGGQQACTTLADGRFVRSGGFGGLNNVSVTNLFTPSSGWSALANTIGYNGGAALVQLDTDRLLIMGGFNGGTPTTNSATSEVYSFASNTWTISGSMITGRSGGVAVKLADGSVLVLGGDGTNKAERWVSGVFKNTAGNMGVARGDGASVTMLKTGKVLVIGSSATAELYDPATDRFTNTGVMSASRTYHTATLLSDGRVLVAGGTGLSTAEIYNPTTGTFSATGSMVNIREAAGAALMKDGRVVVAGGRSSSSIQDNTAEFWGNPLGVACTSNNDCVSGFCTDGVCCGTATCGTGFSCGVAPKLGTCSKTLGTTCSGNAECASGICADGVCCSTSCSGVCASCALPGKAGVCSPVVGNPATGHGSCGTGAGTECGPACDGSSLTACVTPGSSKVCGAKTCTAGVATGLGTCSAGSCKSTSSSCGLYACNTAGDACNTTCTTAADCKSGFACESGNCVAPTGLGDPCKTGATCSTGFCSDGVCCSVSSCGADASCALGTPKGTCGKKQGKACLVDAECGTGHCVDKVCCDTACNGQCQACDVEGYVGICRPVAGAPHGDRTRCDDGGGDVCKARTCKGTEDPTSCSGYLNGPKVVCKAARCDGTSAIGDAFCDGAGTCGTPASSSCVPFICADSKCLGACKDDTQCSGGNVCRGGRCEATPATCSPDGKSSVAASGATFDCAPYRCVPETGECRKSCRTSNDCVTGVCDSATGACMSAPAGGEDSGGCAYGSRGSSGLAILGLLATALMISRKARK